MVAKSPSHQGDRPIRTDDPHRVEKDPQPTVTASLGGATADETNAGDAERR